LDLPPLTLGHWVLAFSPVALLLALVLSGKVATGRAAAIVIGWVILVGAVSFRASGFVLAVALGKGLWLGVWILCVVWPALLLYRLASGAGLERIGAIFASILPKRRENLLVVAWLFPAFIQGVAGFGTPIAVAAPLLLAMGWSRTRAVIYPLIGYHWSVTFGSMGSSFYMASLTAGLGPTDQAAFATTAAAILGVNCIVAGALVLLLDGGLAGLREGGRLLLIAGIPMALTLVLVAGAVPAVATLAGSTVGLLVVALLSLYARRVRPGSNHAIKHPDPGVEQLAADASTRAPIWLLSPYLYLLAVALPVFLWPTSRTFAQENMRLAPSFPSTRTTYGFVNAPAPDYTPIALFGHPGFYILLACGLGYLTYRSAGLWAAGQTRRMVKDWMRSLPHASLSVLLLACVATVLVDTGMVNVLARGAADVTGSAFPLLSPLVGGMGSFITGSTTSSNALFAALQRDVAELVGLPPHVLLAAQTAGGNVGNALAPVVVLIGLTAVDAVEQSSAVFRACLVPAAVLFSVVIAGTLLAATVSG
jgi:lactate permease